LCAGVDAYGVSQTDIAGVVDDIVYIMGYIMGYIICYAHKP
jgi:hypothetical protein